MDSNEEEIIHRTAALKDAQKRRYLKIIGLIFVACLVGVAVASVATYYTLKSAAEDGTFLAQQIQQECEKPGITDPDLEQFCPSAEQVVDKAPETVKVEQVPGPEGPAGDTGTIGATGATGPAPSATAVSLAVRRFCGETGRCDGENGNDATPAQVAIAVSSYCNSRGQCRGPVGEEGRNGEDGQNGTDGMDGADAPPVTQAQLIEAVDAYCAQNNNCRGPAGENGANGTDGLQGPQGPPGVINVADNCEPAPEGMVINDVSSSYDAVSQTVMIDCTYRDILPGTTQ